MKEVSIVLNFTNINSKTAFEEMMFSIRRGDYMDVILQLRKIYASGDKSAYEKAKKALRAFTPSATFNGRRLLQFMLNYSYIIVLDFDKLSPEELIRVKEIVCRCPYTVSCFISPTGNGLKVFVCVKSGPEKHLQAFLSIQKYYTLLTGVEIDASGKDITRLCFVSWDPDLYYEPGAKVFDWENIKDTDKGDVGATLVDAQGCIEDKNEEERPQEAPLHRQDNQSVTSSATPVPDPPTGSDDIFKIYKRCKRFVEKFIQYLVGSRHTFILKLVLEIRKKGIPEITALFLIQQDYDLDIREITKIVQDVYKFDLTRENSYVFPETPVVDSTPKAPPTLKESIIKPPCGTSRLLSSIQQKYNAKNPKPTIDPDDEEIIFPLMEELDEIYYSGGEPVFPNETEAQFKLSKKLNYSHRFVEIMMSKVLDLHYNVIRNQVEWRRKGTDNPFMRVEDHEVNSILRWLHRHDQFITVSMLINILTSNFSPDFDPYLDYFKNLKKVNKKIDYIGQLIKTVQTEDDEYWGFCFRKWFVAYVMSLYRKKVINHTIIVFVGGQGLGKTTFCRTLVPDKLKEYLSPSALTADSKDTLIMMAECCLIILDEFEALTKRDLAEFKELATRFVLNVRRPYGRFSCNLYRHASFICSVNSTQILTDPTGTRRYLCSTVKSIDYEHSVDIDACMAQALALGKSGFKYWFDQDEIRELSSHNEQYMAKSIEEETIETWMRPATIEEWDNKADLSYGKNLCLMKATDVSGFLLTKTKILLQASTNSNVGKYMKKMDFLRLCKKTGFYYIVRVLTDEEVATGRRSLDDSETPADYEQDLNRYNNPAQFIEGKRKEDELPF